MKNLLWRKVDVKCFGFNESSSRLSNSDTKCWLNNDGCLMKYKTKTKKQKQGRIYLKKNYITVQSFNHFTYFPSFPLPLFSFPRFSFLSFSSLFSLFSSLYSSFLLFFSLLFLLSSRSFFFSSFLIRCISEWFHLFNIIARYNHVIIFRKKKKTLIKWLKGYMIFLYICAPPLVLYFISHPSLFYQHLVSPF